MCKENKIMTLFNNSSPSRHPSAPLWRLSQCMRVRSLHVNKPQHMHVLHQQQHSHVLITCRGTPANGGRCDLEKKNC